MKLSAGDLVLVSFPFTDLTSEKRRPGLVLAVQEGATDVIVCAVTSRPQSGPHDVLVDPTPGNGLKVRSWIQYAKIGTFSTSVVSGRLGTLRQTEIETGRRLLAGLFGLTPAEAPSP